MELERTIAELDSELLDIVRGFGMLGALSWPKKTMTVFLKSVRRGNLKLPKVEYLKADHKDKVHHLQQYIAKLGSGDDPAIQFLRQTAQSYLFAYRVLMGIGTKDVNEFSYNLYGGPNDQLVGYNRRNIDVANYFLRIVDSYKCVSKSYEDGYGAKKLKQLITKKIKDSDLANCVDVLIDLEITARAAAGPDYIKIRKGAKFSKGDLCQLFHHEVMIHTLTYINGRMQPILSMLGYSAPHTTCTQEGLAVFAEYINSAMDLGRLKRIALRIVAIDMAERGADFIDLFLFFRKYGDDAEESYCSAMRIMRGGVPEGGIIFYKDNVYLRGLIEVMAFLKKVMHKGSMHDIDLLFCGKLRIDDIGIIRSLSESGIISDPQYVPEWAKNKSELASHLAINDITERFKLSKLF